MPIIVNPGLVTPPTEPAPTAGPNPWLATDLLTLTWTGWTGETWTVQGDTSSRAIMELEGRAGFGMPPVTHFFTESATLDGATWDGYRVGARPFDFPVFVTGASATEARAEQARFMATLRPDQQGTLTVADPTGRRRFIDLRYMSGADEEFRSSTYGLYWFSHKLKMVAEQPYYYGEPIPLTFVNDGNVNFYGGGVGTLAPLYYISNSQTLGNAVVTNPGDVDAWPVWKLYGPFSAATLTVGGAVIQFPVTVSAGQWIQIDTRPKKQTIVDQAGGNRWGDAGQVTFAPIPYSASTQLSLSLADTDEDTKVEVEFTPNFWRAW